MTEPRTYLIGLPVLISVFPDGSVLLDVDVSEADDLFEDESSEYDSATVYADVATVGRAIEGKTIIFANPETHNG